MSRWGLLVRLNRMQAVDVRPIRNGNACPHGAHGASPRKRRVSNHPDEEGMSPGHTNISPKRAIRMPPVYLLAPCSIGRGIGGSIHPTKRRIERLPMLMPPCRIRISAGCGKASGWQRHVNDENRGFLQMPKIPPNIGKVLLESTKSTMVGYNSPPEQWARQAYAGLTAPPPGFRSFISPEIANPKMRQAKSLSKSIPDLPPLVKPAAIRDEPSSIKTPITDALARRTGISARTEMAQKVRDRSGRGR